MGATMSRPEQSTAVDRILATLDGVTTTGTGWQARCPAHEDGRASLSLSTGNDGRALLHCHAGCSAGAIVGAIGLTLADLMPPKPTTTRATIAATYPYHDEHGTHLYDVVRFEPKDFRQRRADGTWKMAGVRRVPYRLPDLTGVASCFIVEGEKDADALAALGLPATCNAGGASKWQPEHSATLKAIGLARVCVLPDNDAPGRAHAHDVARHCQAAGIETRILTLPGLPAKGDVSDWLAAGGTPDELMVLAKAAPEWTDKKEPEAASVPVSSDDEDEDDDEDDDRSPKTSQATLIINLVEAEGIELWHTPNGDPFATLTLDGHREHHPLTRVVRDYVARAFFRKHKRAASSAALTDATATLAGMAKFDGAEHPVAVRLAGHDGKLYLDLGTLDWQVVEITAAGWQVTTTSPVRHWRPRSLRPLPVPSRGGALSLLRELWPNITDEAWTLIVAWLVATLLPGGPFPILVLVGEQGSGKSTLGKMIRNLIDPASPALRGVPRDERDVVIGGATNYIVALDNLSGLPVWLSDSLCRIATGGGFATRQLFTDADELTLDVTRPILLTGIDSPASRGDLLDRALVVTLPAMSDEARGDEAALWTRYEQMRPALLGALLDAAACALRGRDGVTLDRRPRMADACTWVVAAEPALDWPAGTTTTAWFGARDTASKDLIADDAVAQAVIGYIAEVEAWEGITTALLTVLNAQATDTTKRSRSWPGTPKALSNALRRLAPDLRRAHVHIEFPDDGNRTNKARTLRIDHRVDREGKPPSRPSRPSPVRGCGDTPANSASSAGDGPGDGGDEGRAPSPTIVTPESAFSGPFSVTGDGGDGGDGSLPYLSADDAAGWGNV